MDSFIHILHTTTPMLVYGLSLFSFPMQNSETTTALILLVSKWNSLILKHVEYIVETLNMASARGKDIVLWAFVHSWILACSFSTILLLCHLLLWSLTAHGFGLFYIVIEVGSGRACFCSGLRCCRCHLWSIVGYLLQLGWWNSHVF